jgi:predicted DNA binding CopG/RHH family protein
MNHEMKPINNLNDIPADLSDEEQLKFLETHGVSEEFLERAEDASEDERPRPRTRPINVRFDDFTLNRLKQMAERRNVGYQTLLKTFVLERLYEEEKREGALLTGQNQEQRISDERDQKRRDWLNDVHEYIKEHKDLLEEPDLDSITTSRLVSNSSSLLLELSGEIKKASSKKGFPPNKLRRMMKAFDKLKAFCERVLTFYDEQFGAQEDDEAGDLEESAYSAIEEAEKILGESR